MQFYRVSPATVVRTSEYETEEGNLVIIDYDASDEVVSIEIHPSDEAKVIGSSYESRRNR